ncbi:glycosyltransferase [Mesorhizobium sp. M1163]|uniref:CgeB family protein n=1 Tax=Mesorhizobium sp. M1163 TaxID=2957065 RepID=UPI00333E0DF0
MIRKRIMVTTGIFSPGSTSYGLAEGFRQMGWLVQEVDMLHYLPKVVKGKLGRIGRRLVLSGGDSAFVRDTIENCRLLKPDFVLIGKGALFDRGSLREIKKHSELLVNYYPDFHFNHRGLDTESFGEYDLFITTKTFHVEYLKELIGAEKVRYVPHGYVPSVHQPVLEALSEGDYATDILYVGNWSAYKQRWLEDLIKLDPKLDLTIGGNRWSENIGGSVLVRKRLLGERADLAYAAAVQTARINVAIHFGPGPNGWQDKVSTRTFEIPACGGFMLHIDNDEVREFFEPGLEIDVFSCGEELNDKVRFYLGRPDLRAKMIQRAYERAVPHYSYVDRAKAISNILEPRT